MRSVDQMVDTMIDVIGELLTTATTARLYCKFSNSDPPTEIENIIKNGNYILKLAKEARTEVCRELSDIFKELAKQSDKESFDQEDLDRVKRSIMLDIMGERPRSSKNNESN